MMKSVPKIVAATALAAAPMNGLASDEGRLPGRPRPAAAVTIHVLVTDFDTHAAVPAARVNCRCNKSRQLELTNSEGGAVVHLVISDNNDVRRDRIRCSVTKSGYRDAILDAGHRREGERVTKAVRLRHVI